MAHRTCHVGFGLEPVGYLVSGLEAALFGTGIGRLGDYLLEWAIVVGQHRIKLV